MTLKFIPIVILLHFVASTALAQVKLSKTIICGRVNDMVSGLAQNYGESLLWLASGEGGQNNFAMFFNPNTRTWSLIQIHESMACMLGSGQGITVIENEKKDPAS